MSFLLLKTKPVEKNIIFARHARINVYFCTGGFVTADNQRKLPRWLVRKLMFISTMLGYTFVSLLCLRPRFAGSERVRRPTVDPTARVVVENLSTEARLYLRTKKTNLW